MALANFMRLSLLKGARAASSSAAWQEIRVPGWADVWLPALRAWVRFEVYFRVPTQTLTSSFPRINVGAPTTGEGIKFEGKIRSVRALGLPVASEMQRRNLHQP